MKRNLKPIQWKVTLIKQGLKRSKDIHYVSNKDEANYMLNAFCRLLGERSGKIEMIRL